MNRTVTMEVWKNPHRRQNATLLVMLCFLFGLVFLFTSVAGSSAKYCFFGKDINSQDALSNQTCETMETHLAQTLLVPEHSSGVSDSSKTPSNYTMASPDGGNCFIFRHIKSSYLPSRLKKESVHITFGCDYDLSCLGKEADIVLNKVDVQNKVGQLYCCSSDNCNSMDKMPHTPAENRICYSGSSNISKVGLESCNHPDVYCMKMTYFSGNGKYETYSCDKHDNHRLCDPSSVRGAIRFCDNKTVDGVVQELCCCDSNKCNHPSMEGPRKKITHPIKNPQADDKSNKVITGLVAAVVILVFTGIVIILFTAYKKGKQRTAMRRDPNVIMQYERLSSSEPDIEEAVVV